MVQGGQLYWAFFHFCKGSLVEVSFLLDWLCFVLQVMLCCIFLKLSFLHFVWKWWFCGCVCLYNYFVSFSKWCFAITFWCCCFINCDDFVFKSVCTGTLLCSPNGAMLYLSDVVISSLSLKVMILLLVLCALLLCFVLQVTLCYFILMLSFHHFVWKWWFCGCVCQYNYFVSFSKWCFAITFWCCRFINCDDFVVNSVYTGTLLRSPNGAMLYLSDVVVSSFSLKVMILWLCVAALLLHCVLSVAVQFHFDIFISSFCPNVTHTDCNIPLFC